jgi:hypothetical protein
LATEIIEKNLSINSDLHGRAAKDGRMRAYAEAAQRLSIPVQYVEDIASLHYKAANEETPAYVREAIPVIFQAIDQQWITSASQAAAIARKPETGENGLVQWVGDFSQRRRRKGAGKSARSPVPPEAVIQIVQRLPNSDFIRHMEEVWLPRYERLTGPRGRSAGST